MSIFLPEPLNESNEEVLNELTIRNFLKRAVTLKGYRNIFKAMRRDPSGFIEDWKEDIDDEIRDEPSRKEVIARLEKLRSNQAVIGRISPLQIDKDNAKKLQAEILKLISYAKSKKIDKNRQYGFLDKKIKTI